MSKDTVIIGCKLPSGIVLEIGMQTVVEVEKGKPITAVSRGPNYQRIELRGWHAHMAEARKAGLALPAGMDMRPFLNRGVSRAAWEQWKAEHKTSWLLRNEILFEAADEAGAQLRALEGEKTPKIFAPLDQTKPAPGIEVADFVKERKAG